MRVRVVRKLADYLDGVDLSRYNEGDVIDLPRREADLLVAEGWACRPESRGSSFRPARAVVADASSAHRRAIEQRRRVDAAVATRRADGHEHRRAEDRIREERQDAHARIPTDASSITPRH